jgi:antirestriction protein ArdC
MAKKTTNKKINYTIVCKFDGEAVQVPVTGESIDKNCAVRKDRHTGEWVLDNPASGMKIMNGFKTRKAAVEAYDSEAKKKTAEAVKSKAFGDKKAAKKNLPIAKYDEDGNIVMEAKKAEKKPAEKPVEDKPKKEPKHPTVDWGEDAANVEFQYKVIVEKVIQSLDAGIIPWEQPFFGQRKPAYNRKNKKPYILINQFILKHGGEYASYNQWAEVGGHPKKGESEWVFGWVPPHEKKDKDGNVILDADGKPEMTRCRPMAYRVWHVSQVETEDGKPFPAAKDEDEPKDLVPIEDTDLESLLMRYCGNEGIKVSYDNERCAGSYNPARDAISLWKREQFKGTAEFLSTFAHESGHSTGAEKRLNRGLSTDFGSREYAKEELVAELTAAFLLNKFSVSTERSEKNNTAYCQNWSGVLKNDPKLIVQAAARAQKALGYIVEKAGAADEAAPAEEAESKPSDPLFSLDMGDADHIIVNMIAEMCNLTTEWRGDAVQVYGTDEDGKEFMAKLRGLGAVKEAA